MINSKNFYLDYINETKKEITTIKVGITSLKRIKKVILNRLTINEDNIKTYLNCTLDNIKNDIKLNLSSLESRILFFIVPQYGLTQSKLKQELKKLLGINKILNKRLNKLNELQESIITYKLYKDVISIFNKSIIDKILKGENFNLGFGIGAIRIKKKKRDLTKQVIDWNESKKLKKEIIENGGTPYEVLERDKDNTIVKDNNGEKYFVYRTEPFSYWWYWYKSHSTLPNLELYSFNPTTGDNGNIKKLSKYRKENEYAELNYTM